MGHALAGSRAARTAVQAGARRALGAYSQRAQGNFFASLQGSGSYPDRGSVDTDSRQNALPTYLSPGPGRAAKRKKMKGGGTYLLQGPSGRNKTNLPTYLGGASQCPQTPYPGRSRNPAASHDEKKTAARLLYAFGVSFLKG